MITLPSRIVTSSFCEFWEEKGKVVLQSLSTVASTLLAVIAIFSLNQKCTISNITAHNMDFEASWLLLLRKPKQSVELDAC